MLVGGGMGLVNRHFYIPAMRATLAVILAMGSPRAARCSSCRWQAGACSDRVEYPGPPLSRQRLRPAKVLKLNVVDDVSGEHDER